MNSTRAPLRVLALAILGLEVVACGASATSSDDGPVPGAGGAGGGQVDGAVAQSDADADQGTGDARAQGAAPRDAGRDSFAPGDAADASTSSTCTGTLCGGTTISSGGNHVCATTLAGGIKCWGMNYDGELGNGSNTDSHVPVPVTGLASGVTSLSSGTDFTCARTNAGGVKCWGRNAEGALGNDNIGDSSSVPVDVVGLSSGVTAITAGHGHACALMNTGGVRCWGSDIDAQLGAITTGFSAVPLDVTGLSTGVSSVSAGGRHTCALMSSGGVKCWGLDNDGELGNNQRYVQSHVPVDVIGLSSGVASVSSGDAHTCALMNNGGVKCWGSNDYGQLGTNSKVVSLVPVDVVGLASGVVEISAGINYTCARMITGALKCWGTNALGELGTNTTVASLVPTDVVGLSSGVVRLSAGSNHATCAGMSAGGIKCWGSNIDGKLGNGSTTDAKLPVDVVGFP